jgi:peptidyl-tRNA hydrolase, PTH1 family
MKLIAGLGNPGSRYAGTRHNMGFHVTDRIAVKYNGQFKKRLFSCARECDLKISGRNLLLIQPLSFMNLSGRVVLKYARRLNIGPDDILVVYDDIDLPLGEFRIRPRGSSGGHNGMASVIQSFRTDIISRLKVGINAGYRPADLSKYVLSHFNDSESDRAEQAVERAVSGCERWVLGEG